MLDLRKKASFFQGIGPNPLFASQEPAILCKFSFGHMFHIFMPKTPSLISKYSSTLCGPAFHAYFLNSCTKSHLSIFNDHLADKSIFNDHLADKSIFNDHLADHCSDEDKTLSM
jgi:hypothetical protein